VDVLNRGMNSARVYSYGSIFDETRLTNSKRQ